LVTHGALLQLSEDGSRVARGRANALVASYRADYGTALMPYVLADLHRRQTSPVSAAPAVTPDRILPRASVSAGREGRPRFDPWRLPRGGPCPVFGGRPPRRSIPVSDTRPEPRSWQPA